MYMMEIRWVMGKEMYSRKILYDIMNQSKCRLLAMLHSLATKLFLLSNAWKEALNDNVALKHLHSCGLLPFSSILWPVLLPCLKYSFFATVGTFVSVPWVEAKSQDTPSSDPRRSNTCTYRFQLDANQSWPFFRTFQISRHFCMSGWLLYAHIPTHFQDTI